VKALFNRRHYFSHAGITIAVGIVICFALIAVPQANEQMGLPTNVCSGDFCGPTQQDIWNRFQGAAGLKLDLIPNAYSGTCYYDSPTINPHQPQFGGVLIDKENEDVFFSGRFSFHKSTNPYADLGPETLREKFRRQFGITLYDHFAYAEASESFAPFRYWFRQETDSDDLLLVGFFGFEQTILCALNCH
jgi:hypothetical protein